MASLVVRYQLFLFLTHHRTLLLGTSNNPLQRIRNLLLANLLQGPAGGHDGRLVHEVLQVSSSESRCAACDLIKIDVLANRLATGVNLEDTHTTLHIGPVHSDLPVKTSRTEEGGIKDVRTVGCGQNNHSGVSLESIHLGQKLVDGLFALVVTPSHASSALAADSINLIDKHNARSLGLGLLEQVANTGRTHTDEQLNKF
mmetsp:Transcript_15390/g.26009  ORF Transcript_15390/g.26009 Transcript_15390/m.26009 type:complete len:200 (+) Transcript_15390:722-1321(+)